jgi:hypothetical protein
MRESSYPQIAWEPTAKHSPVAMHETALNASKALFSPSPLFQLGVIAREEGAPCACPLSNTKAPSGNRIALLARAATRDVVLVRAVWIDVDNLAGPWEATAQMIPA